MNNEETVRKKLYSSNINIFIDGELFRRENKQISTIHFEMNFARISVVIVYLVVDSYTPFKSTIHVRRYNLLKIVEEESYRNPGGFYNGIYLLDTIEDQTDLEVYRCIEGPQEIRT